MVLRAPSPQLTDSVVTLRPPDEGDLVAIGLGLHDPDVVRWFGQPVSSAAEVLTLNRTRWADGSPTFSICERDNACVGHVWMNRSTSDITAGSIGYWLLAEARGRGLATRAVRLVSEWAIEDLGMKRLRLVTEPANHRSQRVAERSGFRRVALLVAHGEVDGRPVDQIIYELEPDDDRT